MLEIDIHDALVKVKITQLVCAFVALGTSGIRIYIRRGRWWWDDAWVFVASLIESLQIAAVFMRVHNPDALSRTNKIAAYYIISASFYCIVWSSRISILLSVMRIDPSDLRRRRIYAATFIFLAVFVGLISQQFIICEREPGWKDMPVPQCRPGISIAISQIITDVIADSFLIALPLRLLHGLPDSSLRRRLYLIFSTCIATTIVSLVHAVYILLDAPTDLLIAALVENGVSLIVCNLPVVTTALFRWRSNDDDRMDGVRRSQLTASTGLRFVQDSGEMRTPDVSWTPQLSPPPQARRKRSVASIELSFTGSPPKLELPTSRSSSEVDLAVR